MWGDGVLSLALLIINEPHLKKKKVKSYEVKELYVETTLHHCRHIQAWVYISARFLGPKHPLMERVTFGFHIGSQLEDWFSKQKGCFLSVKRFGRKPMPH